MKVHKESVLIEGYVSFLEVISFFETRDRSFGADIYYNNNLLDSVIDIKLLPNREHLLALGYYYLLKNEKIDSNCTQ